MVFTFGASLDFGKCTLLVRAGGMKYNIISRSPPEVDAETQRMFRMCDKRFDISSVKKINRNGISLPQYFITFIKFLLH